MKANIASANTGSVETCKAAGSIETPGTVNTGVVKTDEVIGTVAGAIEATGAM